jgi:hypothetical protein
MSIHPLSIEHDLFYLQLRMQLWPFHPLRHPHLMASHEKIDFVATQRLTLVKEETKQQNVVLIEVEEYFQVFPFSLL